MIDGFYSAIFQTPLGMGGGVAVLSDGIIRGGDSSMYYSGTYTVTGSNLSAAVSIGTHLNLPGHTSVFGIPSATLTLNGTISGNKITGSATAAEVPGIKMSVSLSRLGE